MRKVLGRCATTLVYEIFAGNGDDNYDDDDADSKTRKNFEGY